MTWALLVALATIVVINIFLSGDNALVIGMAAHRLPPRQRRWAIILGGAGAIVLCISFTALAVFLLHIPFLEAGGGVLLTWIAYKLLRDDEGGHEVTAAESLIESVRTILLADVVMSFDNILAIAGASHGNYALMVVGLLISMPIVLFGSSLLARLMNRFPWLPYFGSVILAITAARMIINDPAIADRLHGEEQPAALVSLAILLVLVVLVPTLLRHRRARDASTAVEPSPVAAARQVDNPIES